MRQYGLLGKTLSHSFSKKYFEEKFQKEGISAEYTNFEIPDIAYFPDLIKSHTGLCGLNVTIPYKSQIMPFLDEVDQEANAIGAVNTVAFDRGRLVGFNTDVVGFRDSIKPFLAHGMEKALILGTGGASKAVAHVLRNIGLDVFYASRSAIANNVFRYSDLNANALRQFLLIVNTTPLGTHPDVEARPGLDYSGLTDRHLLYDLVYNPEITAFMQEGLNRGATVVNGLSMLRIQAEHSWRIWQRFQPAGSSVQ